MVTITEKKSHRDVLVGFLTIMSALAAWRGWANARVGAIVFAAVAVGLAITWIVWRSKPLSQVTITPEAIEWTRQGAESVRLGRDHGELELYRRVTPKGPTPWILRPTGRVDGPSIDLFGYDVFALQRTAAEYGWQIAGV